MASARSRTSSAGLCLATSRRRLPAPVGAADDIDLQLLEFGDALIDALVPYPGHRRPVFLRQRESVRQGGQLRRDFLQAEAGALPDPVVPYVYMPRADSLEIAGLIDEMAGGRVDMIAFTSAPQVARLFEAAAADGAEDRLLAALRMTPIAAIGPVVAGELQRHGLSAAIMPRDSFFMKPLVTAIIAALSP